MPCRPHRGTYYASRRTEPPHQIFSERRDFEDFEVFLAGILESSGAKLHAYCLTPDSIHLAITVGTMPVNEVMRVLTGYCSQRIHERTGAKVSYTDSFPVMLQTPETDLPVLLRYIRGLPATMKLIRGPRLQ